jgi:hypothetical protein
MFAKKTTKTVIIRDEDAEVAVVVRKLSASQLELAAEARQERAVKAARAYGADLMKAIHDPAEVAKAAPKDPTPEERRRARYAAYDRFSCLRQGIASWTSSVKLDDDAIKDLDDETATKLHEEVVDLTLGPIDAKAAEAESGKD